ncbi:cell division protein PerM [Nocardia callitridis]|uniref:Uncharacterized protein n=1 Tax=Nocardia callitridis TaxID=648753 RepID=A0ABP9JSV2_9NOCA
MSSSRNSLARRTPRQRAVAEPRPEGEESGFLSLSPERARVLLLVAARPSALALTVIAVLILATLLFSGGDLAGLSGAIAAGWLGVHQVPLLIGTTTLGLLPLLPTGLLLWLAVRDGARAIEPDCGRADLAWVAGAALVGPLLVTAICLAVADDASGVVALQPPNPLAAFGWVLALHLIAVLAAVVIRLRRRLFALPGLPDWVVSGVYGAGRTVLRLLGCATVVVLISFFAHITAIGATYRSAGNVAGVLGLTVLSLAYLPNLVVHAVGVLVGASAQIGAASFGVFSVVGGPVPAVPLTLAVPTGAAAVWWSVLLVIPAGVGVLGGLDNARMSTDRIAAPWATVTSAALATLVLVLLDGVAGGELGTFGAVGLDLPIFALITFGWLAIAGYLGLVFARLFVVPVGAPPSGYLDAHDASEAAYAEDGYHTDGYQLESYPGGAADHPDYYDDYDDYDYVGDGEYAEDENYEGGDHGADTEEQHIDYTEPEVSTALEGELVDDQAAIPTVRPRHGDSTPEIIDAEVVEADLPESDRMDGR